VCLTEKFDRSFAALWTPPAWSGDGRSITVAAEDRGALALYRVSAMGAPAPAPLVAGERIVGGFSVSRDGRSLAFTASDPVSPPEVFLATADGGGERRLTRLNDDWRGQVRLSAPEHFEYERDGVAIDGWVMKPFGWTPGHKYPALLNIHGGPHTQYGFGFFDEFQVYAGAGYVVIYTNPRGSQGCGEAFARAVIADWGGVDYADVMAGLDAAIRRHPDIDQDRLGVLGGSYGGFLTSWIVGHTDRFKAACSERAVNDQWGMFGTSDIGHVFNQVELGALPWQNLEEYVKR